VDPTPEGASLIAVALVSGTVIHALQKAPLPRPVRMENHPWEWGYQILLVDGLGNRVCVDIHSEPFGDPEDTP
jgi:hypothetical protein